MFQHAHASAGTVEVQFGETTFTYAAPTGFKEITAANLYSSSAPAIEDGSAHFQTILWSGNSSSNTATQTGNSGFTPDWAIIKDRNFGNGANSFDSVRGGSKGLATFDSGVEDDQGDGEHLVYLVIRELLLLLGQEIQVILMQVVVLMSVGLG